MPNDGETLPDQATLTKAQARRLTDRISAAAEETWELLAEAHARRAWEPLGYPSFKTYIDAEFHMSRANAYRLLTKARVTREVEEAAGVSRARHANTSARGAQRIAPHLPAVKEGLAKAAQGPEPEKDVDEVLKQAGRPVPRGTAVTSDEPLESHLRAITAAPTIVLAKADRRYLQRARGSIDEALKIKTRDTTAREAPPANGCEHPKAKLINIGWGIKCGVCDAVVKR